MIRSSKQEKVVAAQQEPKDGSLEVTPDRIQARSYEIYEARHGGPGDAVSDWLQAELELEAAFERRSPLPESSAGAISRRGAASGRRT